MKTRLTSLLLLLLPLIAGAQLVEISNSQVQNVYNSWVPGCVDANGYLDAQYPGVADLTTGTMMLGGMIWSIEGLEHFTALQHLSLTGTSPATAISGLPPNLTRLTFDGRSNTMPDLPASLNFFEVVGPVSYGLTSFPPWPDGLDTLILMQLPNITALAPLPTGLLYFKAYSMQGIAELPAFPLSLRSIEVVNDDLINEIPTLPSALEELKIGSMDLVSIPPLPATLRSLFLGDLPVLQSIPTLNATTLSELYLITLDAVTAIPDVPSSLDLLWVQELPVTALPELFSTDLDSLHLANLPNVTEIPAVPGTMRLYKLEVMPMLESIPVFPANVDELYLSWLPVLKTLPPLPSISSSITLYSMDSVQQVSDLPSNLSSLTLLLMDALQCVPMLPEGLEELVVDICPNITCLPNHPSSLTNYTISPLDWTMLCTGVTSICPAISGQVAGKVYHDVNADGQWSAGEGGLAYSTVTAEPAGFMFGCDVQGSFAQAIIPGSYTLTAQPSVPYVISVSPAEHTADIVNTLTLDAGNDFGAILQPNIHDLRIDLATSAPRLWFSNTVWITYLNVGTVEEDAVITLYANPDQTFSDSDVPATSVNGNVITWTLPDLQIGQGGVITLTMNTTGPIVLGEEVYQEVTITPDTEDAVPADNVASTDHPVVGSYDPNDKRAEPSAISSQDWATSTVTYSVRFQNTGTYMAERVIVIDTLSADLDASSFHFVSSSHPCTWSLLDHVVRFTFEGINLPDSTTDEPNSHGFARFTIDPVDIPLSLPIGNSAAIYFDFNAPIITNTAWVEMSTGTAEVEENALIVYPDPVEDVLFMRLDPASVVGSTWRVIDAGGRIVQSGAIRSNVENIDVSAWAPGLYTLLVQGEGAMRTQKFAKR